MRGALQPLLPALPLVLLGAAVGHALPSGTGPNQGKMTG
jgi:hypothetical protein